MKIEFQVLRTIFNKYPRKSQLFYFMGSSSKKTFEAAGYLQPAAFLNYPENR